MLQITADNPFVRGFENVWPVHAMIRQFLGRRASSERRELEESEEHTVCNAGNSREDGGERDDDDDIAAVGRAVLLCESDHEWVRSHCPRPSRRWLRLTLHISSLTRLA